MKTSTLILILVKHLIKGRLKTNIQKVNHNLTYNTVNLYD